MSGYHKMNACCQYTHSAIEAMQQILREQPTLLGGEGIARIQIQTHRLGMTLINHHPTTTLGAKFSLPHALAASLVYGHGGAEAFGSNALQDERVTRLRAQVEISMIAKELPWPQDRPAFVTLVGTNGQTYSANCMSARGGPDLPFDEEELWNKIDKLSRASAPGMVAAMRQLHSQAGDSGAQAQLAQPWRWCVDRFFDPEAIRRTRSVEEYTCSGTMGL